MNLTDMNLEDLEKVLFAYPKFRAKQVFEWINKGVYIKDMSNLPKEIKEILLGLPFGGVEIINIDQPFKSVVKHLGKLEDGNIVESVLMKYKHGNSLCISSQVGCGMGCKFCASTIDGVVRNMTAGEMFFTVALLNRAFAEGTKRGVTNIVVMGSGEPLVNFDNLVKFIEFTRDRLNMSPRNITVSTCGIVEKITELADLKLGCNLALSLHAPSDELRKHLMPVADSYSIKETLNAMQYYFNKTGRRILIEYMLIKDINDSPKTARELGALLKGMNCHVNIIPYNSVEEHEFLPPSLKRVKAFVELLEENGISVTVRRELGDNIDAACGQLRRKHISNNRNY